jgi:opacity protein-like surface antigen
MVFAGPLTDYSAGKVAIDLTLYPVKMEANHSDGGGIPVKTNIENENLDFGITTGLGNKWAIQYRHFNPKGQDPVYSSRTNQTRTQELNVLYQVNKNWSAFAGYHLADYRLLFNNVIHSATETKRTVQFGIIGTTRIFEKTNLYGLVGIGSQLSNLEVGLSYELTPNLELNVSYRQLKNNHLNFNAPFQGRTVDSTVKGWGFGLTCKF